MPQTLALACTNALDSNCFDIRLIGGPAGDERIDVGIAIKNGKSDLCVPGYCAKLPQKREGPVMWGYTTAVADALRRYRETFPWLFHGLANAKEDDRGRRSRQRGPLQD